MFINYTNIEYYLLQTCQSNIGCQNRIDSVFTFFAPELA